jgi:hypothetical protein
VAPGTRQAFRRVLDSVRCEWAAAGLQTRRHRAFDSAGLSTLLAAGSHWELRHGPVHRDLDEVVTGQDHPPRVQLRRIGARHVSKDRRHPAKCCVAKRRRRAAISTVHRPRPPDSPTDRVAFSVTAPELGLGILSGRTLGFCSVLRRRPSTETINDWPAASPTGLASDSLGVGQAHTLLAPFTLPGLGPAHALLCLDRCLTAAGQRAAGFLLVRQPGHRLPPPSRRRHPTRRSAAVDASHAKAVSLISETHTGPNTVSPWYSAAGDRSRLEVDVSLAAPSRHQYA